MMKRAKDNVRGICCWTSWFEVGEARRAEKICYEDPLALHWFLVFLFPTLKDLLSKAWLTNQKQYYMHVYSVDDS